MDFNKHYSLEGKHAFLGASKYHWVNYDNDKIVETYSPASGGGRRTATVSAAFPLSYLNFHS